MDGCFGYALIWILVGVAILLWLPFALITVAIWGLLIMAALFL